MTCPRSYTHSGAELELPARSVSLQSPCCFYYNSLKERNWTGNHFMWSYFGFWAKTKSLMLTSQPSLNLLICTMSDVLVNAVVPSSYRFHDSVHGMTPHPVIYEWWEMTGKEMVNTKAAPFPDVKSMPGSGPKLQLFNFISYFFLGASLLAALVSLLNLEHAMHGPTTWPLLLPAPCFRIPLSVSPHLCKPCPC